MALPINGEALKAIRERTGLSQTALATSVGIDQTSMSHIEAGRRNPSPALAKKIAERLGIPLAAILLGSSVKAS